MPSKKGPKPYAGILPPKKRFGRDIEFGLITFGSLGSVWRTTRLWIQNESKGVYIRREDGTPIGSRREPLPLP
jgi:hypothetical protein